jgi:hypothetical protein
MQSTFSRSVFWPTSFFLILPLVNSCSQQNTYRQDAQDQNRLEATNKAKELQVVVGTYCGKMHLIQSGADFDVTLSLAQGQDNAHSTQSADPTDTVQIPKLFGEMSFPAIHNEGGAAYQTLPDLIAATGGSESVSFTYGDYDPTKQEIYLPFTVAGHDQGNYGDASCTYIQGHLHGTWLSNSYQPVGTFEMDLCSTTAGNPPPTVSPSPTPSPTATKAGL